MPEDIVNPAGIQGALLTAKNLIDEAMAAVARESDGIAAHDLETALVRIGEAQKYLGAAVVNAARNVDK